MDLSPDGARPHDVDASPIAWREAGPTDGEVVVLLHGLGGSRTAWEPQLEALAAAGYRACAWDMPGYGASVPPAGGALTFAGLADAAVAWLDDLGAEEVHVVGLSMGGMVAQHLAVRHQPRVRSLVLVDTSPAFGLDGLTTAGQWMAARLAPLLAGETPAEMAPRVLGGIVGPTPAPGALDAACAAMARISASGLAAAVRCLPTHDLLDLLGEIAVAVLVMVGEHDEETPLSYARRLTDGLPDAQLVVIQGAGHLANLERPDHVNAELLRFLGRRLHPRAEESG